MVSRDGELVEELNSQSTMETTAGWNHSVNAYYNATFGPWGIDFNADYYTSDSHTGQNVMYDGVTDASSVNDVKNKTVRRETGALPADRQRPDSRRHRGDLHRPARPLHAERLFGRRRRQSAPVLLLGLRRLQPPLGKFSLTASLRYEHQRTRYYEAGVFNGGQSTTYNDLLPSASVDYQHGDFSLSLSYRLMKI